MFLWWCFCGGVLVVVFLCWCGGVFVVVSLWWCLCGGAFVVVFLWWCFCGGVFALVFLRWCFCGGVSVVVFLWWCFCGVVAVVFLWWCFCGGVLVVVFLWWCTKYYSSTTKYYSVLQSTTPYYKVLLHYYSVLQSTNPVLLQYYSVLQSTTPVLLRPLKRRQNDVFPVLLRTTPVLEKLPKRAFRAKLPQLFKEQASKMIVSCEASSKFQRTSFQNERSARCLRQFSQKKLPKGSFRARLPPNFTEEASKTSVSREASSKFHRTVLPKRTFRAMLPTILTEQASKMIISCEASSKFHRTVLPKRAFRAMLPTIFAKNFRFATVSRDRHIDSCERVHPPKAKCASHYSAVHSQISKCTFRIVSLQRRVQKCMNLSTVNRPASRTQKCNVLLQFWAIDTTFLPRGLTARKWNLRFATVLGDRHHVFTERVDSEKMKFAFRYSFGRSTPRFYREGWPRENEICVSLQFWAIDDAFLARGLLSGWPSPSRPAE